MDKRNAKWIAGGATALAAAYLGYRTFAKDERQVTYPPLDVPKPVADDLWIVDSGPITAFGAALPLRMTVIRLPGGDLLLHSPTRYVPALGEALAALGPVKHLIAPNIAHWMYLAEWQRAFPDAMTWAAPGLRDRAQVRRSEVRIDHELGDIAPSEWADVIDQGVVPGAGGFREMWFLHQPSRTLILVDLIEDLEPAKLPPLTRLAMRVAGGSQASTQRPIRALLRLAGRDSADAVRAMLATEPTRVVFAHGRWFESDGTERLRRAFNWLAPTD